MSAAAAFKHYNCNAVAFPCWASLKPQLSHALGWQYSLAQSGSPIWVVPWPDPDLPSGFAFLKHLISALLFARVMTWFMEAARSHSTPVKHPLSSLLSVMSPYHFSRLSAVLQAWSHLGHPTMQPIKCGAPMASQNHTLKYLSKNQRQKNPQI